MAIQMTRAEYQAKYGTAPAVATSTPIRMTRAEYEAKYGAPVQAPIAPKYNPVDTLKGKTTFPANTETSNPLGNVARTFGNIPSDAFGIARAAVAPVNPLDTGSSMNIGANISKGFGAVKDIVKNRGLGNGLKDIAGGFADTATKVFKAPGEFIVGETLKAAQDPAKYASDVATTVSKVGIEHPLLVPSLIYGSGAKPIVPALDEATILSTLGDNTVNLAKKLTQRSEKQIASSVLGNYKAGVKPLINAKTTPTLAAKYDEKVVNAVKTIKDNKAGLVFTDEAGAPITGQSPKTLQQFSDAVEQTKKSVFAQYDDLAKKAGDAGVRVDVAPIGAELDTVINNKALALTNPKAIKYAQELQDRLASTGALDATTAQEVIQNYNKSLEAFYRNPSYDNASQAAIDSLVANKMRETLDAGISGMTGTQYGALKSQYGALKAIEKDVIKAAIRDARKNTKGLIDMTDVFSGGQVVNGILSMNPGMIASGATQKGIAAFYKYLNNPNRAINALFKEADKLPVQSFQGKNLPNQSLLQTPAASVIPKTVSTNPMGTNVAQNGIKAKPLSIPEQTRTAISSVETKGSNPLTYRDKTQFTLSPIRKLSSAETKYANDVKKVLSGDKDIVEIGNTIGPLSSDGKVRPIVLSEKIAKKIQNDHGSISVDNLVINANDWSVAVKNLDGNKDKINLIKKVSGSDSYIVLAMNRDNGFFTVSHYEVVPKGGNELKSLLGRGDLVGPDGLPMVPQNFLDVSSALGRSSGSKKR